MSDWKAAEAQDQHDFLYIEEVNANDGASMRLTGIRTRQTVRDLKRAIATSLNNPAGWESLAVAYVDTELDECRSAVVNDKVTLMADSGSYPLLVWSSRCKSHRSINYPAVD